MAAPTPGTRNLPTGSKMPDGYRALITFSSKPGINLWEKDVKFPGLDGGDAIDTTTMHNATWRTKWHRSLKSMEDVVAVVAWDPDAWSDVNALINSNDTVTVLAPDDSSVCFYGFLRKFEPAEFKEGEFPMATLTVTPTNWDGTNNVEAGPVFTAAAGT